MFMNCKRYITVAALAAVAVAPAMAAPPEVPEGMLAVVVIGDVSGFASNAGTLASNVVPMINGESAKAMLAQQIGEENLDVLPKGSGALVMIPGGGQPFGFLETAAGKAEDVAKNLKARTNIATRALSDKLVAIAPTEDLLDKAKAASASAEKLLSGDGEPTIEANLQIQRAMKKYGPQIENMISELPGKMKDATGDNAAAAEMIPGLVDTLYQGVRKLEVLQVELAPGSKGLQTDLTVFPTGGIPASSTEGPKGDELLKLLPGSGSMRAQGTFDAGVYAKLVGDTPSTGTANSFAAMMKSYADNLQDGVAYSLDQTEKGVNGAMAMGVKDEAAALAYLQDSVDAMTTGGVAAMLKAADATVSTSLVKNSRTVEGVNVHKYTLNVDIPNAPASSGKMGSATYDVAVVDGKMLMAAGETKIEGLIKAAKSGSNSEAKELEAASELESGGVFYADYNVGKLLANSGAGDMVPDEANNLPSVYMGGYQDADGVKMSILVPTAFFKEVPKMMAKMQQSAESEEEESDDEASTGTKASESKTNVE